MSVSTDKKKVKKAPKTKAVKESKKEKIQVIEISRDALTKTLKTANDFIMKKGTLPVLSTVKLEFTNKECMVSATDLEVSWTKRVKVLKGAVVARCVPADLLIREIQALPQDIVKVELAFSPDTVKINDRCTIWTMSADDFPVLPDIKGKDIEIDNITESLKKVIVAIGGSDTRYTLNGVCFNFADKMIVGTDGHRLHTETLNFKGDVNSQIIIPEKACKAIIKYPHKYEHDRDDWRSKEREVKGMWETKTYTLNVFGNEVKVEYKADKKAEDIDITYSGPVNASGEHKGYVGHYSLTHSKHETIQDYLQKQAEEMYLDYHNPMPVRLSADTKHISCTLAGGTMTAKLIDGTYPDVKKIIPKSQPVKVDFNAKEFLEVMAGVMPVLRDSKGVKLTVNGKIDIQGMNPGTADYKWSVDAKSSGKGKDKTLIVGMNAQYIIDAVRAYGESGTVTMELSEELSPCLINKKAVIMPMRV
ncbi:MAG: DNA polymerase III subunit beta [Thermodesulfovibrionia bacterium]|nr:DNA polymerase III subunit beta [Thermodesulfovibrionia bacterium]